MVRMTLALFAHFNLSLTESQVLVKFLVLKMPMCACAARYRSAVLSA